MLRCQISKLRQLNSAHTRSLIDQIQQQGFGLVSIDDSGLLRGLQVALQEAKVLKGFRFPPMEEVPIQYNEEKRLAFRSLFSVATTSLNAIISTTPKNAENERMANLDRLREAIRESEASPLFANSPHEPFQDGQPFSQTFFNLFNYNNGLLNPHVDRSLLTVIFSAKQNKKDQSSSLWIENPHTKQWVNSDEIKDDNQVIIMVGDELPTSAMDYLDLNAARHAVKVDPQGEKLSNAHFRPDPLTPKDDQNRLSAAIILRHDDLEEV